MSQNRIMQPNISLINNYKLHIILIFLTGFLWLPVYLYLCFLELNTIAKYPNPKNIPSTKNNAIKNLLLAISFFGLPVALFRKYQLLREYLKARSLSLENITFQTEEAEKEEVEKEIHWKVNVISGKSFVSFSVAAFFLFTLAASTIFLGSYYYRLMVIAGSTGSTLMDTGAYMIFLVIGITAFVSWIAFMGRVIQEELKWNQALIALVSELKKLEKE
ncbi:MAG: hypothetical protein GF308_03350 [Candidatus Heimdallarchaeota archaeon]|nr:hypothetical protein [Candidatus Heimdallarchaeota archaeon]